MSFGPNPTAAACAAVCWLLPLATASPQTPARLTASAFLQRHPGNWRVVADPVTGDPAFVWGHRIQLPVPPRDPAGFHAAALALLDENPELFGTISTDFELAAVTALPLSRVGSTDKVAVVLRQHSDGLPVFNGLVTVLFDSESGDVLAIDRQGVPFAERALHTSRASLDAVTPAAQAAFAERFGGPYSQVDEVQAAIIGPAPFFGARNVLTRRGATLAWLIDVSASDRVTADGAPVSARIFVSAEGDHDVFLVQPLAHGIDGKATTRVNVGPEPSTPTNQEIVPLRHAYLRKDSATGAVLALTGADGSFAVAQSGPLTLALRYDGPYCRINNWNGNDHVVIKSGVTGTSDFLLNPDQGEFDSAEASVYHHVLRFRDFIHEIDPADYTMDLQVQAHVNKDDQPCNAYYSQGAIHFQRAATGCTNTGYQDIVLHEEGHLANNQYILDGRSKPFEEGNADAFAYFINDDPCITDFKNPANCLRNALQTAIKKCPNDGDETCHGGDSHVEGQALASALWAVRERLDQKHGNAAGDALANALFLGWMRAFNDGVLLDVIEEHMLALDDDDGSFATLTPNFAQIHGGFQAYGWNGFPAVQIELGTHPADNAEIGHLQPVTVSAKFTGLTAPVTQATLYYATDGADYVALPMTPTGQPGEGVATIPGVASPNRVRWYVAAGAADGSSAATPKEAAALPRLYVCGKRVVLYRHDFESSGDDGWTHVNLAGSGDQWQRSDPALSKANSDPKVSFSGSRVWGTDLSNQGLDGLYEPLGTGELRSPTLNLSGQSKVFLQYRRWLSIEGNFDRAQILVNDQIQYQNPPSQHTLDGAWKLHDLDVTAVAANNPAVRLQWRLQSDYILEFGGWNLDDVEVYRVDPSVDAYFASYGTGCAGAGGVPKLQGVGVPAKGNTVAIGLTHGRPFGFGLFIAGQSQAALPLIAGCSLLVGPAYLQGGVVTTTLDATGSTAATSQIPQTTAVTDLYVQYFGADDLGPSGILSASNGLRAHIQ